MQYKFFVCDVFTGTLFTGNQLAVIPDAQGLTGKQMQDVAREFNFSETAFVLPSQNRSTRKVRIFTPVSELPFAGHPNIGTAFTLASSGEFGEITGTIHVTFEEIAGVVEISISRHDNGTIFCELKAPERFSFGDDVPAESVAAALSIEPSDILTGTHPPRIASVGLPFVMAELRDISVLRRMKANIAGFEGILHTGVDPSILAYVRNIDGFDLRVRMFAPLSGVSEDPATGSANCAMSGLLSYYNNKPSGMFRYRIGQGFEIGRPSVLEGRAEKINGEISGVWIGGNSVLSCTGTITVE